VSLSPRKLPLGLVPIRPKPPEARKAPGAVDALLRDLGPQLWLGGTPREAAPRFKTGIEAIDTLTGGGFSRGSLSEIAGPCSSGRTSLALALLASTTQRGEVASVVDLADALHPGSADTAGVDLERVLWVRPPALREALRCTERLLEASGFALVLLDVTPSAKVAQAAWQRLARAAQSSNTALVVLSTQRVAGTSANARGLSSDRDRYACIRIPDLLLVSELRAHPELAERPSVVASGPGPGAEIVSVSRLAARQGVGRGTSTAQARTVCAELCVRIASPALEHAARDALLDVALSFSPRAAAAKRASGAYASEAAVFLDASGVSTLFHSERGFASALATRAAQLRLAGDVVIASSRSAALIAARQLSATASRDTPPTHWPKPLRDSVYEPCAIFSPCPAARWQRASAPKLCSSWRWCEVKPPKSHCPYRT